MHEIPQSDSTFELYPKYEIAERKGLYTFYDLGDGYIGGATIAQTKPNEGFGHILAWDSSGNVVFRGGIDYFNGLVALGQTSGSFQRASEHKGHRIGRKMAVVGVETLQEFIKNTGLPFEAIVFTTAPDSSMARIGEYLGMVDIGKGHYRRESFPDVKRLMEDLHVKRKDASPKLSLKSLRDLLGL